MRRPLTTTCPEPCGRPVGSKVGVLCEEHERVLDAAVRRRTRALDDFDELRNMTYERLLEPGAFGKFNGRNGWLWKQVRDASRALYGRKRLNDLTDPSNVALRAQYLEMQVSWPDPSIRYDQDRILLLARREYAAHATGMFDKGAFFDRVVDLLRDCWDEPVSTEVYRILYREFPPIHGESDDSRDPHGYLKQRISRVRKEVQRARRLLTGECT